CSVNRRGRSTLRTRLEAVPPSVAARFAGATEVRGPVGPVDRGAAGAADADHLVGRVLHVGVVTGGVLPLVERRLGIGVAGGDVLGHRSPGAAAERVACVARPLPGVFAVQARVREIVIVAHVLALTLGSPVERLAGCERPGADALTVLI